MYSLDTVTCVSLLTFTRLLCHSFCFFNDTATPEIYTYCHTLSLHDALPIWVIAKGLPASPGAACGQAVFDADTAERPAGQNHDVILVRTETSPEDIPGLHAAKGILTARGGMTSHAAVAARGMGRPCVCGPRRSGDGRVGKEGVSMCRSWGTPDKKNK